MAKKNKKELNSQSTLSGGVESLDKSTINQLLKLLQNKEVVEYLSHVNSKKESISLGNTDYIDKDRVSVEDENITDISFKSYQIISAHSPFIHHIRVLQSAEKLVQSHEYQLALDIYERMLNKIPLKSIQQKIQRNITDITVMMKRGDTQKESKGDIQSVNADISTDAEFLKTLMRKIAEGSIDIQKILLQANKDSATSLDNNSQGTVDVGEGSPSLGSASQGTVDVGEGSPSLGSASQATVDEGKGSPSLGSASQAVGEGSPSLGSASQGTVDVGEGSPSLGSASQGTVDVGEGSPSFR